MRLSAPEHDFFDFRDVELRHFRERVFDGMRREIIGTRLIERPSYRFRQRSAAAGDDDCFSHTVVIIR